MFRLEVARLHTLSAVGFFFAKTVGDIEDLLLSRTKMNPVPEGVTFFLYSSLQLKIYSKIHDLTKVTTGIKFQIINQL